jgi:preprotein translocase subunit SecE
MTHKWFETTRRFIADTMDELRKCSWPSREELFESTMLVIVSVAILAVFVALTDEVWRQVFMRILTSNG